MSETRERRTLEVAVEIARALEARGVPSVVIGAAAVAAHGFPRSTEDFDLATDTDPFSRLKQVADDLSSRGFDVEFNTPDAEDSLGGVIRVQGDDFDTVDVVNYYNPFHTGFTLGSEAVKSAETLTGLADLKVVSLPYLIALKLYGGGSKAMTDVTELIQRRPDLDLDQTREICRRHGLLEGLERVLSELGGS